MSELIVTTVPVVFEESEFDSAYDRIDHFLRGSLDDADYAEYSAALDIVAACSDAERMRKEIDKVQDVLFDGYAVLEALDKKARARTSPENVSDVLDAVVRLMRSNSNSTT